MVNQFETFGIKEVADVIFFEIIGNEERPVLYLDTLKTSTIEQNATNVEARGGKGNPALISWDYNKEISVLLQDALFSMKSLEMIYANDKAVTIAGSGDPVTVHETMEVTTGTGGVVVIPHEVDAIDNVYAHSAETGEMTTVSTDDGTVNIGSEEGKIFRIFYTHEVVEDGGAIQIDINAGTFPGTYKVVGTTFSRSRRDGKDHKFQFIIACAKMASEATITMESEGDPSVFDMNLRVLKPERGPMMQMVQVRNEDIVG